MSIVLLKSGGFQSETFFLRNACLIDFFSFFVLQRQGSGAAAGNIKTSGAQGEIKNKILGEKYFNILYVYINVL